MPRLSSMPALVLGSAALMALAACSPKAPTPPETVSAAITSAQPLPPAPAPAPVAPGAATAVAAAPVTGVGAAGPGKLKLDIKFNGGDVYGDPTAGAQTFAVCSACHSIQPGTNMVGPSLHAIIGRHSGSIANFHYSTANKSSGLVWSEQELYTYLEDPQKTVPGTYMTYTGVKDPQQRADVIAYLQQNAK